LCGYWLRCSGVLDFYYTKKGKRMSLKKVAVIGLLASVMTLTGCGAMTTAVKKRNLEVKTQMSETIWLEPSSEKTVYIQVKNTSDKDMSNLQTLLANDLSAKGYKVTSSPDSAYYWVQANVLKADKMDLRESQGYLKTGYEGAAVGCSGCRYYRLQQQLLWRRAGRGSGGWADWHGGGCDGRRCELHHGYRPADL
jgi:hypothetical protein